MKKISLTGLLLFLLTFFLSPAVLAQNKAKSLVKLPVFMAGDNQIIDNDIEGDLMVAGSQIKITSDISEDAYVAGGQIDINGTVNGNLIVAGGSVTISGKVLKNVIVAGGQIKIQDSAQIGGYVLAGGAQVDLLGNFSGPVKVGAGSLVVGENAVINGDLEADVSKSDISSTSKISGEKKIQIHETKTPEKSEKVVTQLPRVTYIKDIFSFLSKLIILLVFVSLFGRKLKSIKSKNSFWSLLGWGFVILVMTPVLTLTLMVTVIGIPLSFIISGLYFISLSLSKIVTAIVAGDYMSQKGYLKTNNYYLQGFVALVFITVLSLIPFIGAFVKFTVLLFGLGVIFQSLRSYFSAK